MAQIVFKNSKNNTSNLYPFSLTRRIQDFRVGGLTIREKWELGLCLSSFDLKDDFPFFENGLEIEWPKVYRTGSYVIACDLLPDENLLSLVKKLKPGEAIVSGSEEELVRKISKNCIDPLGQLLPPKRSILLDNLVSVDYSFNLHLLNKNALNFDFYLLTRNRKSAPVDKSNGLINRRNVFIEKSAVVKHSILNADEGPIYIGKNALVMEGCCLRGPIFIADNAVVKMGAKIYGATTIGPGCVVGGEIKNCLFFSNSNKAHDGYLGDSVVGEWCNFGAGTSCSNIKNNIGNLSIQLEEAVFETGLNKMGLLMGDFSRTAINTSINTGTVIGVSANVFGNGLTPKHIKSFSWGFDTFSSKGRNKFTKYKLDKALLDADSWKQLKGKTLSEAEEKMLTNIYKKQKNS